MTNASEQPDMYEHTVLITGATAGNFAGGVRPKRLSPRERDRANQARAWQLASRLVADAPTGRRNARPAEDRVGA